MSTKFCLFNTDTCPSMTSLKALSTLRNSATLSKQTTRIVLTRGKINHRMASASREATHVVPETCIAFPRDILTHAQLMQQSPAVTNTKETSLPHLLAPCDHTRILTLQPRLPTQLKSIRVHFALCYFRCSLLTGHVKSFYINPPSHYKIRFINSTTSANINQAKV